MMEPHAKKQDAFADTDAPKPVSTQPETGATQDIGTPSESDATENTGTQPETGVQQESVSDTWAEDVIADLDDFIESQGIYIRQ
jgi:hypothetical protein